MHITELPKISSDGVHKLVDFGLPLERFKEEKSYLLFYKEKQILSRTSAFKPTIQPRTKYVKSKTTQLKNFTADITDFPEKERLQYVIESLNTIMGFELYDPLKGSTIVSTEYGSDSLYLFSAGYTLSQLVIAWSSLETLEVQPHYQVQLPMDTLHINQVVDLKYPIRHISFSPVKNTLFIVRTTSTIHVFTINDEKRVKQIHRLFLADETSINSDIDYSMPIHAELSPFYPYQYLFVTNNGYVSIRDARDDCIVFEGMDPLDDGLDYQARWKSCGIGVTPSSLYIASPYDIKLWEITSNRINTRTLARSTAPITAFAVSKSRSLFCFATIKAVVVFDILVPTKPIITFKHHFIADTPTNMSIENLSENKWRIYLFSHSSQQLSFLDFQYINSPTQSVTRKVTIKRLHSISLSEHFYRTPSNIITSMGCQWKTLKRSDGREFLSVERLFEDGTIRVNYIEISREKPKVDIMEMTQVPRYKIVSNPDFDKILAKIDLLKLPRPTSSNVHELLELMTLDTQMFKEYLKEVIEATGNEKLTDQAKTDIASKVRQLETPIAFGQLFENNTCLKYDLNELKRFLQQLEQYEDIELTKQLDIPSIMKNAKSIDQEQTQQLIQAHDKQLELAQWNLRPLPSTYQKTPFQYLCQEDLNYTSTTTTKVLAQRWQIKETRHTDLTCPLLDTSIVPPHEKFPRCNTSSSRKRQAASDFDLPAITIEEDDDNNSSPLHENSSLSLLESSRVSSQEIGFLEPPSPARSFTAVSTQPLPGAFGSRTKSITKKKKKAKTSGFK